LPDPNKNVIYQSLDWKCTGAVKLNETTEVKVMDFEPRILYTVEFKAGETLGVLANKL
jgi:hypothetical protein